MSGLKYSVFDVLATVAEILLLRRKIKTGKKELDAVREQLKDTLQNIPEWAKSTLQKQIRASETWFDKIASLETQSSYAGDDVDTLRTIVESLQDAIRTGRALLEVINASVRNGLDQLSSRVIQTCSIAEQQFTAHRELIERWLGKETASRMTSVFSNLKDMMNQKKYSEAEKLLAHTANQLQENIRKATELEDKHQKRLYLLKALRQVCSELGFQEVQEPYFERENSLQSRIVYRVDTLDKGQITFYLALDHITSHSEIEENKCFGEFEEISKFLKDRFGVITNFKRPELPEQPKLIQKGELEEPTDSSAAAAA